MKIVFLDIDGVLNSHKFLYGRNFNALCRDEQWKSMLDRRAIYYLNQITEVSGAVIVISSSWRIAFHERFEDLKQILKEAGVKAEIIDRTPSGGKTRGEEISRWFWEGVGAPRNHQMVDGFVILDDDSDIAPLKSHHVKTTFAEGLLEEHVEQALKILGCS